MAFSVFRLLQAGRRAALLRNYHDACRFIASIHEGHPGLIHLNRPASPFVIVAPKRLRQAKIRKARRHQPVPGTCPARGAL